MYMPGTHTQHCTSLAREGFMHADKYVFIQKSYPYPLLPPPSAPHTNTVIIWLHHPNPPTLFFSPLRDETHYTLRDEISSHENCMKTFKNIARRRPLSFCRSDALYIFTLFSLPKFYTCVHIYVYTFQFKGLKIGSFSGAVCQIWVHLMEVQSIDLMTWHVTEPSSTKLLSKFHL